MQIYLVQHGQAKSKDEDADRPLTEAGIADIERIAASLSGRIRPNRIVHSGKTRAWQTTEILARHLQVADINEVSDLDPMADPGTWSAHLAGMREDVILVGHLPHMGRLASLLVCGDANADAVRFQPGAIVCLERQEEGWGINWMLPPALMG